MKEVIILARGMTKKFCPFDCEVWGVNTVHEDFPDKKLDKLYAFDEVSKEFIESQKKKAPVVSWQKYADEKYPLKEIIQYFGTKYFANSICYMIAHAIYLGYEKIKLYGVDHAMGTPWYEDRTAVEYWLGRAEERGIIVEVPEESQLLKTVTGRLYGAKRLSSMKLWLFERAAILGLLPDKGDQKTVVTAYHLKYQLGFSTEEVRKHKIEMERRGNTVDWQSKSEAIREFVLSKDECNLIKSGLRKLVKQKRMPELYLTLYEKFIRT